MHRKLQKHRSAEPVSTSHQTEHGGWTRSADILRPPISPQIAASAAAWRSQSRVHGPPAATPRTAPDAGNALHRANHASQTAAPPDAARPELERRGPALQTRSATPHGVPP